MSVRVRFAPSPTGYLHVGGLRTALYNFLFARRHGGVCILRMEDTDRTRLVEGATEGIIEALRWCGIEFDESPVKAANHGPYTQSERLDHYAKYAKQLLDSGHAYYAFDSGEELQAMRERQQNNGGGSGYERENMRNEYTLGKEETARLIAEGADHVIRLRVPSDHTVEFEDIVRGQIRVESSEIDDQVLLKSDGFPTYHLANVVDDHLMEITHIIRGEEWLPSTPKHMLLYDAFGWTPPRVAHLPLLLNMDRSKLSKRQGDVAVEDYRDKGYLPEALVNFVALLGYNPTGDRELYNMQEMIDLFDLSKVNKAGAVFDLQKLDWMNFEYLKQMDPQRAADMLMPALAAAGHDVDAEYVARCFTLLRERLKFTADLLTVGDYLFAEPVEFDPAFRKKHWKATTAELLTPFIEQLHAAEDFGHEALHALAGAYTSEKGVGFGKLMNPMRLMLTGKGQGAGMFETMELLGKERCMQRIDKFMASLEA